MVTRYRCSSDTHVCLQLGDTFETGAPVRFTFQNSLRRPWPAATIIEVDILKYFARMFALKYLFDVVYLHVLEPRLLYLYTCMSHITSVGPIILHIMIVFCMCVSVLSFC